MFTRTSRSPICCISTVLTLIGMVGCASNASAQEVAAQRKVADRDELALYVSITGNDTWSGRLAEPNAAGTDGPLATIQKARDIVRESKAATSGLRKPVTVLLRGGVYQHHP